MIVQFCFLKYFINMPSLCVVLSYLLFPPQYCAKFSCTLLNIAIVHSFSECYKSPLCQYTTIYVFFSGHKAFGFFPVFCYSNQCLWNIFFLNIYLFIYLWLCWVFVSVRGLSLVVASGSHSSSRCAGLSLARPLLLRSTGSRRAGSVVVAHGPSCPAACGIFPDQGLNPCPLHWQADSQPLRHQGSPVEYFYTNLLGHKNYQFLFNIYVGAEFLCHGICEYLTLKTMPNVFGF